MKAFNKQIVILNEQDLPIETNYTSQSYEEFPKNSDTYFFLRKSNNINKKEKKRKKAVISFKDFLKLKK